METSSPESLIAIKKRITNDKIANFKGAARVLIQHLEFPHSTRQIDRKAVRQLIRDFDGEGCIREEPSHRIPAIVDHSILQAALEKLSLTLETFKAKADDPPFLELGSGVKLECLHGQHRTMAAMEHLAASQWWWVIDIYGTDLGKDTKQSLREGYSYSTKYTSGEVFRHMRLCHYDNDYLGAQRWRGRLTPSQDRFFEQLLKRPLLVSALDSVLHIQGLWREFYVGSLDVFLFPKCDEEISHYINHTKVILTRIFNGDMPLMMHTDPMTIQSIQSRCPAFSRSDYEFIQENMDSGHLFPYIVDSAKRADITRSLLEIKELIPSLYTLIKDIRYLKQPAELLSKLLPSSPKKTLRQRWFHHFTGIGSNDSAITQQHMVSLDTATPTLKPFDVCYQQLWLCAYRLYKYPNAYSQWQLADLASRLGFATSKIRFQITRDPAHATIEKALRDVFQVLRPNEKFDFDVNKAGPIIASFKRYINSQEMTQIDSSLPSITVTGKGTPLTCRCGQGQMDFQDLAYLFLDKIHAPLIKYRRDGDEISSFYVKRSRHLAFFEAIDLIGDQEGLSTQRINASRMNMAMDPVDCTDHQYHRTSQKSSSNEVADNEELMVKFIEKNITLREVPYREVDVNRQAKEYADQGKKLHVQQGPYFIWTDCFNILTKTRKLAVNVTTLIESRAGKRRWGEDLPDRLQPATKEAYEFEMNEDQDEEL